MPRDQALEDGRIEGLREVLLRAQLHALRAVAFAALSPPALFRLERAEAVATARRLAHLVVYGIHSAETFRAGPQPRSVK